MPDWSLVKRAHVVSAMDEFDRVGSKEFLQRYGFRRAHAYTLWHDGNEYDSKAILGVAYLHATGRGATSDEFFGKDGAAKVLEAMGFDVVVDEKALAKAKVSKAAPLKPRRATADKVFNVCPTCRMAIPATGVCDNCG
jgi:hypothetical protein